MMYRIVLDDSLEHHGIKGQKWGVRNGPPYPLTGFAKQKAYDRSSGMSAFAKMKTTTWEEHEDDYRHYLVANTDTENFKKGASFFPAHSAIRKERQRQEYLDDPDTAFEKQMSKINRNESGSNYTVKNCTKCSSAMILARMGYSYDAGESNGGDCNAFGYWFDNAEKVEKSSLSEMIQDKFLNADNGSYGTVDLRNNNGGGHVFNWQKDSKGGFSIFDSQDPDGEKYSGDPEECFDQYFEKYPWFKNDNICRVFDMTNASPNWDHMTEDSVIRITDDDRYSSRVIDWRHGGWNGKNYTGI